MCKSSVYLIKCRFVCYFVCAHVIFQKVISFRRNREYISLTLFSTKFRVVFYNINLLFVLLANLSKIMLLWETLIHCRKPIKFYFLLQCWYLLSICCQFTMKVFAKLYYLFHSLHEKSAWLLQLVRTLHYNYIIVLNFIPQ